MKSVAIMAVMSATEKLLAGEIGRALSLSSKMRMISATRGLFASAQAGICGTSRCGHGGVRVPEILGDRKEEIEFGPPVPHFDHADLDGRLPKSDGSGWTASK